MNASSTSTAGADSQTTPGASPLFWLCLLVAAALYAACALAGRVVVWTELQREYSANQARLVGMERQVQHLQRVVEALERDPEFATRLARAELNTAPPGAEVITPEPDLVRDPLALPEIVPPTLPGDPWYLPAARRLAADRMLRRVLLGAAAATFLLAFLFCRERPVSEHAKSGNERRPFLHRVFRRYLRAPDEVA